MTTQLAERPVVTSSRPGAPAGVSQGELLILLREDQRQRWQAENPCLVEDYLERFPQLGPLREAVLDLIYQEMLLRREHGQSCDLDSFVRRFPDYRNELRDLVEMHQLLEGGGTVLQSLFPDEAGPATYVPTVGGPATPRMVAEPTPTAQDGRPVPTNAETGAAVSLIPDGYEIESVLGRGGMGVVYKARDRRLGRLVALKMILAGPHAGPEDVARFRTEAEAVAGVQHPNIVQIFEVGQHGELPYFCLEYVEGGSLAQKLGATPQPPAASARLVETLARAIHHAHQHGIVHRDLKPANVLLTAEGEPKITDFGLAKKLDVEKGQTRSGDIMGTPSYMAPEQASGRTKHIGPAADIYALGAILYEMLTGRPPFKGLSGMDTILQVMHAEPVSPSSLRPGIPRDLVTICLKCLQKEPHRRYASAADLADDLHRYLENRPILARPVGWLGRTWKWARRAPFQAAFVAASVLLLFAFAIASAQQASIYRDRYQRLTQSEQDRKKIEKQWLTARELMAGNHWVEARTHLVGGLRALEVQRDLQADELQAELKQSLQVVEQHVQQDQDRQEAHDRRERFLKPYDDTLFYETLFTGLKLAENRELTRTSAQTALAIYGLDGEQATANLTDSLERDRSLLTPAEHAQVTAGCYELLLIWAETEADPLPGQADTPALAHQRGARALALLERASALGRAYGIDTQTIHLRKARYLALSRGERFDPSRVDPASPSQPTGAMDWFLKGLASYRAEQYEQAGVACERALHLQASHFWARYLLGLCHLRGGRWLEAKGDLTVCLNQRPAFAWPLVLRGFAASELAVQYREQAAQAARWQGAGGEIVRMNRRAADAEFASARADFDEALGRQLDTQARYVGLVNRGTLLIRQERWTEAIADLKRATEVNPAAYQAHVNLAQALRGAGRLDEAVSAMDGAIQRAPDLAALHESRARLHEARKDRPAARADFERAIALEPKDSRSDRLVNNLVELGRLLHRDGKNAEALASYDRALKSRPDLLLTQRFRAEALLALSCHAEAEQALDAYLAGTREPPPEVYRARGLLHARTGHLPAAIEMYSAALRVNPNDTTTRGYRAWAYLMTDALRLGLEDFEVCLKERPDSADFLIGRASAHIRLKQLTEAITDAQAAEVQGPLTDRLLYHLSCIYAQAAAQLQPEKGDWTADQRRTLCVEKALNYLARTMEELPGERRASFWRNQVETDPLLAPIRQGRLYYLLAARYGSAGP